MNQKQLEQQSHHDPPVARIASIMVSAVDAESLAAFWSRFLAVEVASRFDQFIWLNLPDLFPGSPERRTGAGDML
ncbi:hypothetical protein [Arthrobacter sp.]|uniref:hypothetical protein n=1 Tax=Arthrobacter sp. TaxID=1667 RepID=UPI0028116C83|nr:hypothetical protein [Arthrobacter sp.]